MKVKYNNNKILLDEVPYDINLNYDRCFGRIIRKYNAMTDEVLDLMDLKNFGLRTLLVMEIIEVGNVKNVKKGDYVVISAGHPVQINIMLKYLIDDMGDEYVVVPEDLMMFRLPNKSDDEVEILLENFVKCEFEEVVNTNEDEAFDVIKCIGSLTRVQRYKMIDNNNTELENGKSYLMDKRDMKNTFPLTGNYYLTSVNNFKIEI